MKNLLVALMLFSTALLSSPSMAGETTKKVGKQTVVMDAKPATKGEGYSTFSYVKTPGVKPQSTTVTCSCADGTSTTKTCPIPSYQCNCPNASISCD